MPALPGALWTCPGTACGSWGLSRKAQPKGMTQGGERPSEKGRLEEVAFKLGLEVWGGGLMCAEEGTSGEGRGCRGWEVLSPQPRPCTGDQATRLLPLTRPEVPWPGLPRRHSLSL